MELTMDHKTDFYWLSVNYWRLTRLQLTTQCVAPVLRNCVSQCLHASLAPMAKCAAQFVNGSRFQFWCSALIKCAAHLTKCVRKNCAFGQTLRIWSNAVHFANWSDALRICWSNAPYIRN